MASVLRSSWKIRQNGGGGVGGGGGLGGLAACGFFLLEYPLLGLSGGFEQGLGGPTARSS